VADNTIKGGTVSMQQTESALQLVYLKGFSDGMKVGVEQGILLGVDATIKQVGHDASERLRNGDGNIMVYYKDLKQRFGNT
jgi:hypothetical protein